MAAGGGGGGGVTGEVVAALAGPVAAVFEAVDAARFAAGPHAAGLVQDARQRAG
jgi:hypothetical protein